MFDGIIPLWWLVPIVGILGATLVLGVVCVALASLHRDYGLHPVRWVEAVTFGVRHKLIWPLRKRPIYEFDTRIYCGLPGSGKTLLATYDAVKLMRRDVRVLSNFCIRDPLTGKEAMRLRSWVDMLAYAVLAMLERKPTVFVLDEIHLWASARFFQRTPGWWLSLISQRRHFGCGIIGTAQHPKQIDVSLRRLLDVVVFLKPVVKGFGFFVARECPAVLLTDDGEPPVAIKGRLKRIPWWVYGSYSTEELVAVEEWLADDAEADEQIAVLTAKAQELGAKVVLPWVGDADGLIPPAYAERSAVLDLCEGALDGVCEYGEGEDGFPSPPDVATDDITIRAPAPARRR